MKIYDGTNKEEKSIKDSKVESEYKNNKTYKQCTIKIN